MTIVTCSRCGASMPTDGPGPIVALLAHWREAHPANRCPGCGVALVHEGELRWCMECGFEEAVA